VKEKNLLWYLIAEIKLMLIYADQSTQGIYATSGEAIIARAP